MKTLAIGCGVCLIASSVSAALTKDDVRRLNESTRVISELRNAPDNGIPKDLWNRAQCVLVVPSLARFTFLVVEYGSGVMSCRRSNGWSHPVFVRLANRSWGLQLGPQQVDLVLLVMNRSGAHALLQGKVSLGVDVSIAAGPGDGASNAAMDARMNAQMLSYSRSHGVFAGIDLSVGCCNRTTRQMRARTVLR